MKTTSAKVYFHRPFTVGSFFPYFTAFFNSILSIPLSYLLSLPWIDEITVKSLVIISLEVCSTFHCRSFFSFMKSISCTMCIAGVRLFYASFYVRKEEDERNTRKEDEKKTVFTSELFGEASHSVGQKNLLIDCRPYAHNLNYGIQFYGYIRYYGKTE
jgi:hypothetical protein